MNTQTPDQEAEKNKNIVMNSPVAMSTLAPPDWKFTFGNPAAVTLFGAKNEEEFLAYEPWKLSPETQPDGRNSTEKAKEMINIALQTGFHSFEWIHKKISGELFYVEVYLFKVGVDDSAYVNAIVVDITERKTMENKVKESEERLKKAQIVAQVGNWELDIETRTIWASEEVFRIYGIERTSPLLPLEEAQSCVLSEFRPALDQALEALIKEGIEYNQEFKLRRKNDNAIRYIHSKAELHKDTMGKPIKVLGVIQDITDRKLTEESLKTSQLILQNIIDLLPVRIFWKDVNLRYMGCNKAFAQDAGKKHPLELLGKDDFEMGWKDQANLYREDDMKIITTGVSKINYEEPQTTPSGDTIWLLTNKMPLKDDAGKTTGILGTYQDITGVKKTENELRAKNEELERLNESMINRELKMIELKQKITELEEKH